MSLADLTSMYSFCSAFPTPCISPTACPDTFCDVANYVVRSSVHPGIAVHSGLLVQGQ